MNVLSFIRSHPRLISGVVSLSAIGAAVYLGKRKLDRACPRVPLTALPKSSVCRNLIETAGETATRPSWGMTKSSPLLAPWPGSDDKTYWIPSYAAMQAEVPVSVLAKYGAFGGGDGGGDDGADDKNDVFTLMQNLVAAFLDARAAGPEAWFLDEDVPPLSFAPASHLFGEKSGLGAFMLGTWSSARGEYLQPLVPPEDAPRPVSEFPSNRDAIHDSPTDAAGSVIYWSFADGMVKAVDKAASYGLPWRVMQGGFQEFIVEMVSEKTARVTYISVECASLHPGGQPTRDFKTMPRLAYELHVLYAQFLLYNTVQRLRKPRLAGN